MTTKILSVAVPLFLFVHALGTVSPCRAETKQGWKKAWIASVVALVGANALDIHSSQGRPELNPLLRNSNGRFSSRKAILIKSAASGGFLLLQALLIKKMPERNLHKPFAIATGVLAGYTGGSAARNYSLRGWEAPTQTTSPAPPSYLLADSTGSN